MCKHSKELCVAVLGKETTFLHGSSKQGKINVKVRHFELNRLGEQERCRVEKFNFGMAWRAKDFNLIKNHSILKI